MILEDKLKDLRFEHIITDDKDYWEIPNTLGGLFTLRRVSEIDIWEAALQDNIWSCLHLTESNLLEVLKVLNVSIK